MSKSKCFSIILIFVLGVGMLAAQDALQLTTRLKTQLMQQLSVSEQEALQVMEQLRVRLRNQKQQQLALDDAAVGELLKLCKQNRIKATEVPAVLAAGSTWMHQIRQYGEPLKTARQEMCMTMAGELKRLKTGTGEGIGEKVATAMQTRLQTRLRQGTADGSGQMNQYRKNYHGERGYSGSHGGKRDSTPGPK